MFGCLASASNSGWKQYAASPLLARGTPMWSTISFKPGWRSAILPTVGRNIAAPGDTGTPARSAARPNPLERAVCEPGLRVAVVGIEAQADHARPLLPMRDDIAPLRIVEIEPPHGREAVGVFAHRRLTQ